MPAWPGTTDRSHKRICKPCSSAQQKVTQEARTRSVLGSGRLVGVLLSKLLQALFKPVHHSWLHEQARVVQVVYDKLLSSRLGLVQAQDELARWLITAPHGIA